MKKVISLGILSLFDRKELKVRESKVAEMKKNLKKCEQNQIRSKKSRENRIIRICDVTVRGGGENFVTVCDRGGGRGGGVIK